MKKAPPKTIGRDKVRGKLLEHNCYDAKVSRYEYGPDDPRCFCYGLQDAMTDEYLPQCKSCKAFVSNATPPEEEMGI